MAIARAPQKIALLYAVIGCLWILFSDQLVALLWQEPRNVLLASQFKGWGFVVVTALFLYWLIRRSTERLVASEMELRRQGTALASADSLLRRQLAEVEENRQRLDEVNHQLESLFEASPLAIVAIAADGTVTRWNRAAEWLFGWTAAEIVGHPYPLVPPHLSVTEQQYFEHTLQGKIFRDIETRRQAKNGTLVDVSLSTAPLRTGSGTTADIMVVLADISERKRLDEGLRLLGTTLQQANVAVMITTSVHEFLDAEIVYVNQAFSLMTGYTRDEAVGRSPRLLQGPGTDRAVIDWLRETLGRGEVFHGVTWHNRKDGSELILEWHITPIRTEQGVITHFAAMLQDVTARRNMEEALRESEERYRLLFERNPHPMWVYDLENLSFLAVNSAAVMHYGYTRDEFLAMTIKDIRPVEDVPALLENLAKVTEGLDRAGVWRHRTRDGRIIAVEITTHTLEFAGRRAEVVLANDVTERLRAETALRENEALLNTVLDTLPVGLWIADRQGRLIRANRAAEQLWGGVGLVGMSDYGVYKGWWVANGEPIRAADWALARVIGTGRAVLNELVEIENFAGQRKVMLNSAVPLYDEHHETRGAVVVNQDITELHGAEQEVRKLNAELEQRVAERTAELAAVNSELESFSYSVSHDLRAPLRHIDGFSRALLEDCADQLDEKGKHNLDRILAATRHLGALIDDLLQLARVTRHELWRHPLDLSELARDISRTLQEGEPARHVAVKISDGLVVDADPRLMRVALENLLGNAWKYTGHRADAEIVLGQVPDTTPSVYFIRDNGVGFDMAFADKLFSPFQRLHHRNEFEGTGIGLATVRRILERHGGSIWAEAKEGAGATFFFTLDKSV